MDYNLKDEEEVKQFLENLGTEYRFGCFSEKKPEGEEPNIFPFRFEYNCST